MDYTTFPTYTTNLQPPEPTNKTNAVGIYGTGNLGGANGLSFGGNGGINGTQGMWLGGSSPSTAPFSVDLRGDVVAKTLKVNGIPVGGAAADVNSHSTTINASQITANSITASQIASGTITGTQIAASTITASNMNVTSLAAISATLGAVSAGTITSSTVTGGTVQTASSNQRVALNGSTNALEVYDTAGTKVGSFTGSVTGSNHYLNINNPATNSYIALTGTGTNALVYMQDNLGGTVQINGGAITITGNTNVVGTLTANGVKPFDIDHPTKEGWRLRYIALEGPEVLVVCRGKGKVVYPQHFIDVSEPGTFQVIKSGWWWNRTWIATAVRKGFLGYVNEYEGTSAEAHPSNPEKTSA